MRRRGEGGFGLVELVLAIGITAGVLTTTGMALVASIRNTTTGRDQQRATEQLRNALFWLNQDTQSGVTSLASVADGDVTMQWLDYSTGVAYSAHYVQVGADLQRTLTVAGTPSTRVVATDLVANGFAASLSADTVTYTLTVTNASGTQSSTESATMRVTSAPPTAYPTVTASNTPTITPTYTFTSTPTFTNTPTPTRTNTPTPTKTNTPTNTPTNTATPTNTSTNTPTATATPAPCGVGVSNGLNGAYYDNSDFTAFVLNRVDSTVNFDWAGGSPDPSIGADTFSVRWTGQVIPLYSQTYTFYTQSDDGVRLWVNNVQVVDNWTDHGSTENSGTIALTAGVKYDVTMEYYENGGQAVAKLSWSSASQAKQIIPSSQLCAGALTPTPTPTYTPSPTATKTNTPSPTPTIPPVCVSYGLNGAYYDNMDFTSFKLARVDATVNFDWGTGSPDPSIGTDTFSVRWTGQVIPLYSQTYTFYTQSDDGVRLVGEQRSARGQLDGPPIHREQRHNRADCRREIRRHDGVLRERRRRGRTAVVVQRQPGEADHPEHPAVRRRIDADGDADRDEHADSHSDAYANADVHTYANGNLHPDAHTDAVGTGAGGRRDELLANIFQLVHLVAHRWLRLEPAAARWHLLHTGERRDNRVICDVRWHGSHEGRSGDLFRQHPLGAVVPGRADDGHGERRGHALGQ